jgi:D-alanyl-D-alanine endopeptidase (penicillin-binding protein 7)
VRWFKLTAALALAMIALVGYARQRGVPERPADRHPLYPRRSAQPVFASPNGSTDMPAGPWAMLQPPRKLRPRLRSHAACVVECQTGAVLYGRRADAVRPIASIVKLLTALVYLESGGDLEAEIEITPEDARNAGKSILWKHHRFKARDVLHAALMSSDNRAARALARSTPYTREQFMTRMQERAQAIGCTTLRAVEPTGLSEENVASATDVARLLAAVLANPTIAEITRTYHYSFKALNSRKRYRLTNSNRLLPSKYKVRGGKTGYILESGWCVASMIETANGPLIAVVLGARSNSARFSEARKLADWAIRHRHQAPTFALAS